MWLTLQNHEPHDYVIATGEAHSVREFADLAFSTVGLDYRAFVKIDPQFMRPTEVDYLCGDYSLIKKETGWTPKTTFQSLVKEMVEAAMEAETPSNPGEEIGA